MLLELEGSKNRSGLMFLLLLLGSGLLRRLDGDDGGGHGRLGFGSRRSRCCIVGGHCRSDKLLRSIRDARASKRSYLDLDRCRPSSRSSVSLSNRHSNGQVSLSLRLDYLERQSLLLHHLLPTRLDHFVNI